MTEFGCSEVILCGSQDVKIQLLTCCTHLQVLLSVSEMERL